MSEPIPTPAEISAWKAQQEANRAARIRQRYSPEEIWRQQQEAIAALANLRTDGCGKAKGRGVGKGPSPSKP